MTDFVFSPKINYPFVLTDGNEGKVLISGISIPEDPNSFFMPLKAWIDDFLTHQSDSLIVNFEMFFYNRTTSNYFYKLLHSLKKFNDEGKSIVINWYHYPDDEDVKEDGEDLEYQLKFPIHIMEYQPLTTFNRAKTDNTPLVYFDHMGDIILDGKALGKKPWEYFYPLIKWADSVRFAEGKMRINFEINIEAIDEMNLQYLKHILNQLKIIDKKDDKSIHIKWKCVSEETRCTLLALLDGCGFNHSVLQQ